MLYVEPKAPSVAGFAAIERYLASGRLEAFLLLIKNELGYQLHDAVQRTTFELSTATEAEFAFESGPVTIRKKVTRADIDRVFPTGGSSFVPAVRQIFVDRFGAEKVTGGEELTSVTGLALRAREQWPAAPDPAETR